MDALDVKVIQKAFEVIQLENKNLKDALDNTKRNLKICSEVLTIIEIKFGNQLEKPMFDYLHNLIALTNTMAKK